MLDLETAQTRIKELETELAATRLNALAANLDLQRLLAQYETNLADLRTRYISLMQQRIDVQSSPPKAEAGK